MPNNPNHLIHEKSPYLLQHAANPVLWYPWCEEAFTKAKADDKPILLSVGYSTCHWCHVMAHESFENEEIAQMINADFVAIKVDREERPDIDHIYMTATTALAGSGGWPLTVFLTPEAKPFYGGTYFPPFAKWGVMGFTDLLQSIASAWKTRRADILSSGDSITAMLRQQTEPSGARDILDAGVLELAFRQMSGEFDPAYGGFGSAPKFPMGHYCSFLLCYGAGRSPLGFKHPHGAKALAMVEKTLTAMARGGIYDHLGGGFHRYATDQQWRIPHFEKMLYDQALLSRAYLESYQATGRGEYAGIAREIFDYVLRDMRHPQGAFYCAEDADSLVPGHDHKSEGAFYIFSEPEVIEALGAEEAAIFNYCYGVQRQGNAAIDPHGGFVGKNILYLAHDVPEAARQFHKEEGEIHSVLAKARKKLLASRAQRPRPHLDDKILTDWNGLMIASLSFGGRVLDDQAIQQSAVRAADFILAHLAQGPRLLHRWREGQAGIAGTLEDYAFFIYGLLEVYEATFEEQYLHHAKQFAGTMIELFADHAGGFYLTASDGELLIVRPKNAYDGAMPSGNSVAALDLLRLYVLTQEERYKIQAQGILKFFAHSIRRAPIAHAFLLSALDFDLSSPLSLTFEGNDKEGIAKMVKVVYKYFIPHKVLSWRKGQGKTKACLCHRGMCYPPMEDRDALEQKIKM